MQSGQLAVEIGSQPVKLFRIAQVNCSDFLIKSIGEGRIVEVCGKVGIGAIGPHGHHTLFALITRFALRHFLIGRHFGFSFALLVPFGHLACHFGGLRIALAVLLVVLLFFFLSLFILIIFAISAVGRVRGIG